MQPDVIIVGGGFTGASLASALADGKRQILVLEARAGKNPRFAGELIHPTGVDVLDGNGLLRPLQDAGGVPVNGFAVVREPDTEPSLLPYAEIPGARPNGFAIEHHKMVIRLREAALARPGVAIRTGARVVDVLRENGRVAGVRLDGGEEIRAPLTLAAEGRHSKLRGILGIEEEARLLSFTAAVLARDTTLPSPGYGHIFLGAWGPILAYSIGHGEVRMCLDLPSDVEKGTKAVAARLRADYARFVPQPLRGAMLRALDETPPEMAANYAIYTKRCTAPGVALVGESGGCSHPLTAAGMTVCLTDIRILVEELGRASDPREIDSALASYQTRRYQFVRAREILADALYEVFRGAEDSTRAIRHGIFRYWDSSVRSRASSMALLSGHDSRLASFLGEYLRVVVQSTGGVLRGQVNDPSLRGRVRSFRGLGQKAIEKLGRVVSAVREGSLR
jgi:2-polyprenyl-6-methoxyphenol hydroxylase-like FAD-dependent oxidoreductase